MRNQIICEDLEFIAKAPIPWKDLEGKNILITGATGFLPAYMIELLLFLNDNFFQKKVQIFALARNKMKVLDRFQNYGKRPDLNFLIQDVCLPIIDEGTRFDFVIHAASLASPKFYGVDPVGTILANTVGTANLLALAEKHKSEAFLFFSSAEVYGDISSDRMPIREDCFGPLDPLLIRSCYAEGKRAGENMCISWSQQYGLPVKIIRPFHTYGPGMSLDDGRVFADFVSDIVHGRNIQMTSDGSAVRAFCYLADAVVGFFMVLLKGSPAQAYNIGNDLCKTSIVELAELLIGIFPEKRLKVVPSKAVNSPGYIKSKISVSVPDTCKIRALGWSPSYSLKEGFARTIRSFSGE
ncbi:MAG: NAD-dependent epimerase/dehydratase family protein [Candidatus Omnitrophica bacterium]|nr:NAD-dependent epimerase/dehydratase family protein [Candidatus Omnitrophota bacterium]